MSQDTQDPRIFDDRRRGVRKYVVLPWRRTMEICVRNVRHRIGRSMLTFTCVAVVVAFFASSLGFQDVVSSLMKSEDVHVKAVLEKAGVSAADVVGLKKHRDQRIWLMTLSGILCLVGITNTILMSVTERYREIGTLKCLGALNTFVVRLFMIESLFIGVLGSFAGAVAGFLLGLVQAGASFEFGLLTAGRCLHALAISMPASVGLGTIVTVLAAVYPTYVAARMKPVEAMRAEV
jgi:putative ABC transport system permease protein